VAAFERQFHLELHLNTTPSGRSTPDYPGEITSRSRRRWPRNRVSIPKLKIQGALSTLMIFEIPFD